MASIQAPRVAARCLRATTLNPCTIAAALAAVVALASACKDDVAAEALSVERLYALETIPRFDITLDEAAIAALEDEPREWVRGGFAADGRVHHDVGVRLKGHRSMRDLDDKPAFKISFDEYVDDRQVLGTRSLTLNNMVEDPTMVREIIAYRLARGTGVEAPDVGYAEVSVNGESRGLYLLVETVDEDFLARHFDDGTGPLFEGEWGCDLYEDDAEGFDRDGGKGGRKELASFGRRAAGPADALFRAPDAPISIDDLARFLAFETFVGNFDGYYHGHNYRIYRQPSDERWRFIPWGLDRAFVREVGAYDSEGLLAVRCFGDAQCRSRYLLALREVAALATELELSQGVRVLSAVLADAVARDESRPHDDDRMRRARKRLSASIEQRIARVAEETACLGDGTAEIDADGDGHGCMDCRDGDASVHPGAAEICGDGVDNDCSGEVDDDPSCGCPVEIVGDARYAFCDLPMPWHEADAFCRGLGGRLAEIDDAETSAELQRIASDIDDERWWIGATDRPEEGAWRWSDGSEIAAPNWNRSEPDNDGCNQDCGALKEDAGGAWQDTHCGQHEPFVCRLDVDG